MAEASTQVDRGRRGFILALLVAGGVIAALGTVFWIGYQGSDDGSYIDGALAWYRHFPQVGKSHWDLRYPIVFAIDGGFRIFGINELAVGVAMLAYLFAAVALSIWMLQRWFGLAEGLIFIALFCAMPGVIVVATYANADVTELFYVVASLALYCVACESGRPRYGLLIGAGICAGLAFTTRETTIGLICGYGLLFLFRPGIRRWQYFVIGAGFALVVLLEMGYFTIETGDPLWRFTLDTHHDVVDRATAAAPGQIVDQQGNLAFGPVLSPLLVFFATQKYALIFYLMLCMVPVLLRGGWNKGQRIFLVAAGTLFVAWAGCVIFNVWLLYLVPRYFVVTAWVAAMFGAVGLVRMWPRRPRLAAALLVAVLLSDAASLYVENDEPIQASRAAVAVAVQSREPVYTDPYTHRRGRFVAEELGVADDFIAGRPKPGALFVLAPDSLAGCNPALCGFDPADFAAGPGWQEVARIVPPPRAIGRVLDALRLTRLIPAQIRRKLIQPNAGVIVYRVG